MALTLTATVLEKKEFRPKGRNSETDFNHILFFVVCIVEINAIR
jgi:hypothetical protein